jgi:hypothetical protein
MAQASSYPSKSPVVAADKVLVLDSADSNAIKQATVADVAQQAANGVSVPRSSGSAVFAIDSSGTGSNISLADTASATPFGNSNNFSGLIIVKDVAGGWTGLFFTGGGVMALLSDLSGVYAASDTPSKFCLFLSAGVVTLKNRGGSSRTFSVTGIRVSNGN